MVGKNAVEITKSVIDRLVFKHILRKIKKEKSKGYSEISIFPGPDPRIVKKLMDEGYKVKYNDSGFVIYW